jgi:hypothetical protein
MAFRPRGSLIASGEPPGGSGPRLPRRGSSSNEGEADASAH